MEKLVVISLALLLLIAGTSFLIAREFNTKMGFTGQVVANANTNTEGKNSQESESAAEGMPEREEDIPRTHIIDIKDLKVAPAELKIKKGDTVVWVNNDIVSHQIYSGYYNIDEFTGIDSGYLNKGDTYSKVFNEQGTFLYRCKFFPYVRGQITVE
jgi:plastocyanin